MLERFMKINLANNGKLDINYTNHSIRSTVISTLDKAGFEARHIMHLSSHKSESTIKEYAAKCPENKEKEMFNSLQHAITPPSKIAIILTATQTAPKDGQIQDNNTPDIQNIKDNLPNFDLNALDYDTIGDNILTELLTDFQETEQNVNSNNNNSNSGNAVCVTAPQKVQNTVSTMANQQFNTQVINQNAPMRVPRMPVMYFPNSNVTINYNFNK